MKVQKSTILIFLGNTFATTVARGISLPFMSIYISVNLKFPLGIVGTILTASLLISIFFNFFSGYLADKYNKIFVIFSCMLLFSLSLFLLPMISTVWIIIFILSLIYISNGMLNITAKACISDWVSSDQRSQIFSLNYTLSNAGWAIGTPIGVMAAKLNLTVPFYISGGISFSMLVVLIFFFHSKRYFKKNINLNYPPPPPLKFFEALNILAKDCSLIYFTIGSVFISLVFSQYTSYISQYLLNVYNEDFAYKILGVITPVNASLVILLQYVISKDFHKKNTLRNLFLGALMFIIGIIGFWVADKSILIWIISMVFFTLGEIMVIPTEYMIIDRIAPENLRGGYYGVQNLRYLGGAFSPIMAGFILSYATPIVLFITLIIAIFISLFFYFMGHKVLSH
ncbi:MFS transporter [Xenorhabdus sp. Reich]|uniref:MFS transporter n=1 Tax=Xenorhabdus littoralis TaxID=2582835 RepID=A0ABU4SNM2_9GAMM|nr:MFS transporter [Xenorhabdus sp. Reich]MDX8000174.1 MFS transporter [Xenorhabdus sp. Reich]